MITCTMSRAQDKEKSECPTGIEPTCTTLCTPKDSWRAGPYTRFMSDLYKYTVKPRYNKGPRDWQKFVRHTEGLRYIEVRYTEVPLYLSGLSPSDSFDEALADMIHDGVNDLRNDLAKGHFEKDETKKV